MRNPRNPLLVSIAACLAMACVIAPARQADGRPSALGTAFTYQGQLKQGGLLYSGAAEFQFRMYDAATSGNQIGAQINLTRGNAPTVTAGLFNVMLDFGMDGNGFPAFNGEARWLEIDVRTGVGAYTTLSPRQAINATPYALATRGVNVNGSGSVGIGTTMPESALHVAPGSAGAVTGYATAALIVENSTHAYINLLAPHAGEEGIFFGNPTGGPTEGGMIYNNFQTPRGLQFRTAGNVNRMVINQFGRVGIGTADPGAFALHVVSGDMVAIYSENSFNSGTGVLGWAGGNQGNGLYGYANSAIGTNHGVMGQSNSAAGYDFYANGAGINYGAPSSIRWKSNVQAIADPLGMLDAIRGVYFDWDAAHGGQHDIGFIGEEVGRVLPEVVAYEEDCEFVTGMDYSKLTPLLVEAVKALRAEKDAEIAELRENNQRLQDRLAGLEAAMARLVDVRQKR